MPQLDYINWLYRTLSGDPRLHDYFASGRAIPNVYRDRKTIIPKIKELLRQRGINKTDAEIEDMIDTDIKQRSRAFDEPVCPQYVKPREDILSVLTSSITKEIEDVPVILLPTMSTNAHALLTPEDDTMVVISFGLDMLLEILNNNLARMCGSESPEVTEDKYKFSVEQTMACVEAFVSGNFEHLRSQSLPDNFDTVSVVSKLNTVQRSWILAHEYAHMIKKHLSKNRVTEWSLPLSESLRLRWYIKRRNQEFEADEYATAIVCQLYGGPAIGAIPIMLTFFDFCNEVRDLRMPEQGEPSTHPSPIERLDRVKHILNKCFDQRTIDEYGKFPDAVESWFGDISSGLSRRHKIRELITRKVECSFRDITSAPFSSHEMRELATRKVKCSFGDITSALFSSHEMEELTMRKEVIQHILTKINEDSEFFKRVLMQPRIALANYNLTWEELSVIVAKTIELVTTPEEFMELDRIISYWKEVERK